MTSKVRFLFGFFCLFVFSQPLIAQTKTLAVKSLLPDLILCGKKHNSLFHIRRGKMNWDCPFDGPLKDVQPQPQAGTYLVTGASQQVALIEKIWKGCKTIWDWTDLDGIAVESAVVADWDEKDNPTLILAADSLNQRLFLADAKSKNSQIRWVYKLPAPPRRVHLCTESGNFLVTLKDSTVEEVFFQEDKVVMTLGKADGLMDARDAVRDPWANTYVADAAQGDILSFGPKKQLNWKTHLPFAPGPIGEMSLALFRKEHKRLVMAAVHFTGKEDVSHNVVYILNSETGKVLAWNDHDEKGGYPAFSKAVPDRAEYYKKQ
jgi:hypothetical protein